MKKTPAEARLCAVFVDYDNIYLSLRRQDELAAKQFPRNVIDWLGQLQSGELITETGRGGGKVERRLVMCRCYGNPVPRSNANNSDTDKASFPFVRHHFQRAGFDIVDCPPLTAQLKNSSDIRMVMDIQDFLEHKTHFDEFIILSGDADFAPILQRLRTHARHTTIYVNDNTAVPYIALCDAQVREQDLLNKLMKIARKEYNASRKIESSATQLPDPHEQTSLAEIRNRITAEIEQAVLASTTPVALSFLADKAQRSIGYDETVGSNWAGYGSFMNFLQHNLPRAMRITSEQPYCVIDERRHYREAAETEATAQAPIQQPVTIDATPAEPAEPYIPPRQQEAHDLLENNHSIRDTISRVHEYTHVPALAPSEYQIMFEVIAEELNTVGLKGRQTAYNISSRAKIESVELTPEDAQFVLDIISEADPWFEKGISPPLFAERFLNAIVARCRSNSLVLNQKEYDLVAAWFTGNTKSLYHQQPAPQLLDHHPTSETPWMLPNQDDETLREPPQQLRQPYIDPFGQGDLDRNKELPRIFRFGSDR